MNRRQKKKNFKKKYGFNPPKNISLTKAEQAMKVALNCKRLWEDVRTAVLEVVEVVKKVYSAYCEAIQNDEQEERE